MTSERRIAANRANARKSTGPKTEEGRRRASQNARRHGLTTALSADRRAHHLGIILDDPRLRGRPLSGEGLGLAQSLADAEAQLERVKEEEVRFHRQCLARDGETGEPDGVRGAGTGTRMHDLVARDLEQAGSRLIDISSAPDPSGLSTESDEESRAREMRRLLRYRSEAESRRHRLLKEWIAFLGRW